MKLCRTGNGIRKSGLRERAALLAQAFIDSENQFIRKCAESISNLEKIENAFWCIDKEVSMKFYNRARMGEITYAQAEQLGQEGTLCEFARRYGLSFKFDSWETVRRKK